MCARQSSKTGLTNVQKKKMDLILKQKWRKVYLFQPGSQSVSVTQYYYYCYSPKNQLVHFAAASHRTKQEKKIAQNKSKESFLCDFPFLSLSKTFSIRCLTVITTILFVPNSHQWMLPLHFICASRKTVLSIT